MKKVTLFIFSLLIAGLLFAQVPESIRYQAIVRDGYGNILPDQNVNIRITLFRDSANGIAVYSELHAVSTNSFGLINLEIGKGSAVSGTFGSIHWDSGNYFVQTEADVSGGSSYVNLGTTQLLTVPYAMYARKAALADLEKLTQAEIDALTPPVGFTCYNLTTGCLYYWNGVNWNEICGTCAPRPTQADAGPDQLNLPGTTAFLAGNTPVYGTGTWTIISGAGGTIATPNDPASSFSGATGIMYLLEWKIMNACGTSSDTMELSFSTGSGLPCPGIPTVSYGGQTYNTVQIGNQCWMKENLNIGTMISGANNQTNNAIIEKYCYNNDAANCEFYGGLYQWNEMMQYSLVQGSQGICPVGWHLPTDAEWCTLTTFIDSTVNCNTVLYSGINVGGKMKEPGTVHWLSPNVGATNESGFTALPGGLRDTDASFGSIHTGGYFWTSTIGSGNGYAWHRNLYNNIANIGRFNGFADRGFSVRCIKDTCASPTSANAGPDQLNVTLTTVTLAANQPLPSETGTWAIVNGTSGSFVNVHDPSTNFTGLAGTAYTLSWSISNSCNTSVDYVDISFASGPIQTCPGVPTVNYGGQTYNTVLIGSQCWLKENLNIGTMINGSSQQTNNSSIEKFCFNDDPANCTIYGGLYQWNEMMQYVTVQGSQGICPTGWHLPTDGEWCTLSTFLDLTVNCNSVLYSGTTVGAKLKEAGTVHWQSPNTGTNESGFTALPGGYRDTDASFGYMNTGGYYWTSTVGSGPGYAWHRNLGNGSSDIGRFNGFASRGFSVRCIKDTCTSPTSANAGPDQLNVAATTVTLAANQPLPSESGTWAVVSGANGSFLNVHDPLTTFSGVAGSAFTLSWSISNSCDTSFDFVNISFASGSAQACPGVPTVTYGGQTYNTVLIGTQCWLKENLNIGNMINGTSQQTNNSVIEKYCFNNLPANCTDYGGLYQWNEMMQYSTTQGSQGICPAGWHLPTDGEWCTLTTFLDATVNCNTVLYSGITVGAKLKEEGTVHWQSPNTGTNESGFTALPGGYRDTDTSFGYMHTGGYYWTSSVGSGLGYAWHRNLGNGSSNIGRFNGESDRGFSVRCIKD